MSIKDELETISGNIKRELEKINRIGESINTEILKKYDGGVFAHLPTHALVAAFRSSENNHPGSSKARSATLRTMIRARHGMGGHSEERCMCGSEECSDDSWYGDIVKEIK